MGNSVTGPSPSSLAVSKQRHHWLENICAVSIPFSRKRAPIRAACLRPSSDRFLCVLQSPIANSDGSPVPGAMACRRRATCPFEPSARQSAVSSAADTPGAVPKSKATANAMIAPERLRQSCGLHPFVRDTLIAVELSICADTSCPSAIRYQPSVPRGPLKGPTIREVIQPP